MAFNQNSISMEKMKMKMKMKIKMKKVVAIFTAAFFFLLLPITHSQLLKPVNPLPLCASQFALANYACSRLPISPPEPVPSPPSPPPDDDDDDNDDGEHGHHRGSGRGKTRRHRHHHHSRELTPAEENCCRWVRDVDTQCVCDILVRLPEFLSRAAHQYVVSVGESCQITYSCGGRIKI